MPWKAVVEAVHELRYFFESSNANQVTRAAPRCTESAGAQQLFPRALLDIARFTRDGIGEILQWVVIQDVRCVAIQTWRGRVLVPRARAVNGVTGDTSEG